MSDRQITIKGGAGPAEAAAIAAAIQHLLDLEAEASAELPQPPRLSAWVQTGMRTPMSGPRRPATQFTRRTAEDRRII